MTDMRSRALFGIDISKGRCLEIGPLNRPLLSKASTATVLYADHCSTEALREKYAGNPDVPLDRICEVDFDLSQMRLGETGRDGKFDLVVASHVIEHVPDLVGWLREIENILTEGGVLALVVPDKRFTFDIFRRETAMWMVREAVGRSRPSVQVVIDHFVNNVHADTGKLWKDYKSRHDFRPAVSPEVCPGILASYAAGDYIDAHCWVVTPASFLELLRQIIAEYSLSYELQYFEPTSRNQLEFYAQLKKSQKPTDWNAEAEKLLRDSAHEFSD